MKTVYCLVPAELAERLHDVLRRFYSDDPSIQVVVERRSQERREAPRRRATEPNGGPERRALRNVAGRRVDDRRALAVVAARPELPRRARPFAARLLFIERIEPGEIAAEDIDSSRLVLAVQGGDREAFSVIYLRYFDRVYSYVRVAIRDRHEAEDLTQQVFMRTLEAIPRIEVRAENPFRDWLFRTTRNHVLNHVAKHSRLEVTEPAQLDRERETDIGDIADNGIESSLRWLTDAELVMLIERLPPLQRQVVAMRFLFGLSTQEIADTLECQPATVRQLQSRALRFLNKRLSALGRRPTRHVRQPTLVMRRQLPILRERRFALV